MVDLQIIGDIDEDSFRQFQCEVEADDSSEVNVSLHSRGGDAVSALAFYDYISGLKARGCKVNITVYGRCHSAAVLVLAAGSVRRMSRNSWVMVHEDSVAASDVSKSDQIHQAEAKLRVMRGFEDQWNRLLYESTGTAAEEWKRLHQAEAYLAADDCFKLGLIDFVL